MAYTLGTCSIEQIDFLASVPVKVLTEVARGNVDLNLLAREELADRGYDQNGVWVGFSQAEHCLATAADQQTRRVMPAETSHCPCAVRLRPLVDIGTTMGPRNLTYLEAAAVKSAVVAMDLTGAEFRIRFGPVDVYVLGSGSVEVCGGPHGNEEHADIEEFKIAYGLEDFRPGLLAFARDIEAMCELRLADAIQLKDRAEERTWERYLARCRAAIAAPLSDSDLTRRTAAFHRGRDDSPETSPSDVASGAFQLPRNITRKQAAAVKSAMVVMDLSGGDIQIEFGSIDVFFSGAEWLTVRGGPHGYEEHPNLEEFTAAYGL